MNRPTPTDSVSPLDFSLNWTIRRSSPIRATQVRTQASSVCSATWDWTNRIERLGVDPAGQELRPVSPGRSRELGRVPRQGHRVEVDDAEEGVVLVLLGDPVAQRPQVVAEVGLPVGWMPLKTLFAQTLSSSLGLVTGRTPGYRRLALQYPAVG